MTTEELRKQQNCCMFKVNPNEYDKDTQDVIYAVLDIARNLKEMTLLLGHQTEYKCEPTP